MADDLETVDSLPMRTSGKVDWAAIAVKARENPDKWVKVPVPLYSGVMQTFKRDGNVQLPVADFEMTTQRIEGSNRRTFFVRVRSED